MVSRLEPERYQRLMDLFDEACDQSPAEQKLLVQRVSSQDRELGKRLALLLEHDASDDEVLPRGQGHTALVSQPPISDVPSARGSAIGEGAIPRASLFGLQLGDWVVHEHLGSGAVGSVHRVEHVSDGRVGAMKLLKHAGLSDPNVLDRFC